MIKNSILLGCAGLVGAALVEIFLFIAPQHQAGEPQPKMVFCEGAPPEQRLNASFGRTGVPGGIYFRRESEADGWHLHAYNQDGFRDLIDVGSENVLVLGDSFIEGELVDNDQTIPYLLDAWNPDLAFRSFALGGWGTDDQHRVYQAIGAKFDHRLVVLGYYVGNDLADNLEAISAAVDPGQDEAAVEESSFLFELHSWLRGFSRAYTFFYVKGRLTLLEWLDKPSLEDAFMSLEDVEKGIEATGTWLSALSDVADGHDAELLIVTLPSWNELIGIEGERRLAQRQRDLIRTTADAKENVRVLDLKDVLEAAGYERLYGRVDKHFNAEGYYLAAKAIHEWINGTWRAGEAKAPAMARNGLKALRPDCALVPDYLKAISLPERDGAERVSSLPP